MADFSSFGAFAAHLLAIKAGESLTLRAGLEEAAKIVEATAKEEIGRYQPAIGEFEAWPELADSTKKDRVYQGFTENDPLLRTGALRESISHIPELITMDGDSMEATIGSTSDIMVWQELGTKTIPPRPVLGPAALRNEGKIQEIIGEAAIKLFHP